MMMIKLKKILNLKQSILIGMISFICLRLKFYVNIFIKYFKELKKKKMK